MLPISSLISFATFVSTSPGLLTRQPQTTNATQITRFAARTTSHPPTILGCFSTPCCAPLAPQYFLYFRVINGALSVVAGFRPVREVPRPDRLSPACRSLPAGCPRQTGKQAGEGRTAAQPPFNTDTIRGSEVASVSVLRPIQATALSCWFGFLACLLSCVRPALAGKQCSAPTEASAANGHRTADGDCCHHSSNRKKQPTVSCCPLDATLLKQRPGSLHGHVPFAVAMPLAFDALSQSSSSPMATPPTFSDTGRDVLLQTHVLRI